MINGSLSYFETGQLVFQLEIINGVSRAGETMQAYNQGMQYATTELCGSWGSRSMLDCFRHVDTVLKGGIHFSCTAGTLLFLPSLSLSYISSHYWSICDVLTDLASSHANHDFQWKQYDPRLCENVYIFIILALNVPQTAERRNVASFLLPLVISHISSVLLPFISKVFARNLAAKHTEVRLC